MDIAQIFADYIHLLGMTILLAKLWLTKNCAGISGKTQLLYAMVFTARYTDLTIRYNSLYDTILKIIYLSITYCTVLLMFLFLRKTYDRKRDVFRIELLIIPCAVLALFVNERFATLEVFQAFSMYLEAVTIVPQVYLVSKSKQVDSIVVSYVSCLGLYRGCYLMHWLYAYFKQGRLERLALASGIVQLVFYCDFFARNLPILKPKNCPPPPDVESNKPVDTDKDAAQAERCSQCRNLVVAVPAELTAEEKVTLLAAKEQGASNHLKTEILS